MFLSKLTVNLRRPDACAAMRDINAVHVFVWHGFPNAPEGGLGRILFRVEPSSGYHEPVILVQSEIAPQWELLGENLSKFDVKPYDPAVSNEEHYRFRLRANPTMCKRMPGRENRGIRTPITAPAEQSAWLNRKGVDHGFTVTRMARAPWHMEVSERKVHQRTTHISVLFEGDLIVTDYDLLSRALHDGIGPGKAFGFGLLSLARIK